MEHLCPYTMLTMIFLWIKKFNISPVVMALAFNPRRQRQVNLLVQGQPDLHWEFQDGQSYTEELCLEKEK